MKKTKFYLILFLLSAMLLTACGTKAPEKYGDIDLSELKLSPSDTVQYLYEHLSFDDELYPLNEAIAAETLRVTGLCEEIAAMAGTGGTAEILAVIHCGEANTETVIGKLSEYLASMKSQYATYKASEVPKLESALVEKSGNYVILVVSGETGKAKTLYEDYAFSQYSAAADKN